MKKRAIFMCILLLLVIFFVFWKQNESRQMRIKTEEEKITRLIKLGYTVRRIDNEIVFDSKLGIVFNHWSENGLLGLYGHAKRECPISDTRELGTVVDALTETTVNGIVISDDTEATNIRILRCHNHWPINTVREDYRGCSIKSCNQGYTDFEKITALKLIVYGRSYLSEEELQLYHHITDIPPDLLIASMDVISAYFDTLQDGGRIITLDDAFILAVNEEY